jgi:hypothetical protein
VGPMPLYTPFRKTSSLMLRSNRYPFIAPFTPMGYKLPHLHNDTLGYSFMSGAPGIPFGTPSIGTHHLSTFHYQATIMYILSSDIVHFRYLMFVCVGTWHKNIQPTHSWTPYGPFKYILKNGMHSHPLLIIAYRSYTP